jgi:hypothetical protein
MRLLSSFISVFISVCILALSAAGPQVTEAADLQSSRDHVVIRIYDLFGLPDETLGRAHLIAGSIFQQAGIRSAWLDCEAPTHSSRSASYRCDEPLSGNVGEEVVVRIIATPEAMRHEETLGYSYVDMSLKGGVLSTVFADRIDSMARRTTTDVGTLLGRAVAHEVGHLLLGTINHSTKGLMRALWSDQELRLNLQNDWTFSKREAAAMRSNLIARARMETPAVVTASKIP